MCFPEERKKNLNHVLKFLFFSFMLHSPKCSNPDWEWSSRMKSPWDPLSLNHKKMIPHPASAWLSWWLNHFQRRLHACPRKPGELNGKLGVAMMHPLIFFSGHSHRSSNPLQEAAGVPLDSKVAHTDTSICMSMGTMDWADTWAPHRLASQLAPILQIIVSFWSSPHPLPLHLAVPWVWYCTATHYPPTYIHLNTNTPQPATKHGKLDVVEKKRVNRGQPPTQ